MALAPFLVTVLIWVLPFHAIVIAYFFGVLHTGVQATTMLAAWKEGVVVAVIAVVVMRSILSRGPGATIAATDIAITGLIALAVLFALIENPFFGARIPPKVELFGFRSSVFFMVLYYVGRTLPELGETELYVKHVFWLAVVVAAIAIVERIFVSPRMLVALGAAAYVNDFLGLTVSTAGNDFGLPSNYWSVLGHSAVRRAGSVFLGGQAFALPFLVLMPAATAWVFDESRKLRMRELLAYAVIWIGLLLSITRMTILACALQIVIYFLIARRPTRVVAAALIALAILIGCMIVVPGLAAFVLATLTFQTASSYSHVFDWRRGVLAFAEAPWGHGLGSSDQVAARFGRTPLTADNMFLGYAVDMGVFGLIGCLAVFFTIAFFSWQLFRTARSAPTRIVAITVFLADIGIVLNGTSSAPFNSVFLGYNFFILAGATITAYQLNQRRGRTAFAV